MDLIIFLVLLISIICTYTLEARKKSPNLPPGPFRFPIIGNILQVGSNPHRSLTKLSQKYGPVMSLKLGGKTTVVISSPEVAKLVLQKHDLVLSGRTVPISAKSLNHHEFSIIWQPVRDHWKNLRKICKEQLFSVQRLDAIVSQGLRREKMQKLCDYVGECAQTGRPVDLADATFTTTLNLTSAMLFSVEIVQFDSDQAQEMKKVIRELFSAWGRQNLADYIPVLNLVDPHGIRRQSDISSQKLFDIFDGIIDAKLKSGCGPNNDFVDALSEMIRTRDEAALSINEIKHLLLDLFIAGGESNSVVVEWGMTELLRKPEKMSRLREEIITIGGKEGLIQESDMSRLPYLQAVVKETLRLHPPGPLMIPHQAEADVEINGYTIPKNTQILVNLWGCGRDSNVWPNADSFIPERFLDENRGQIEFGGKDFKFIPFGAGRRICPGLPLAHRVMHLMLATLVHKFSWRVEGRMDETHLKDKFGLSLQKAIPLKAIPMKL